MVDRRCVTVLLAWLTATATTAMLGQAQENSDDPPSRQAAPTESLSEQIVVTATRTEQPRGDVTSTIDVIDTNDIERADTPLVADLLRWVPGVDVRRNGPLGSVTSIFLRGADSDHTLVLLDGVELNDPSSPSRTALLDDLTTDGIERIEVLRGPQSMVYGSDAVGGVIQILTRPGSDGVRTRLWVEAGSYQTYRGGVSSSGVSGRWRYSVAGSALASAGFSADPTGIEDDGFRDRSLGSRLGFAPDPAVGLDLTLRHTDSAVDFDGFSSELGERIDAEQSAFSLTPSWVLAGGAWHQRVGVRGARHLRDTSGANPTLYEGRLYTVDWQSDYRFAGGHTLTAGVEQEWEQADLRLFDDSARTGAAFVEEQVDRGAWFATIGARYDDRTDLDGETTARAGVGRRFETRHLVLRGSYGTGFKAPSLAELSDAAFAGNPDLGPERSKGYDLGVEQSLRADRLRWRLTWFDNDIDHLIVSVFDPSTFLFLNVNVDRVATRGVESGLDLSGQGWRARLGYTYTHTEALGQPASFGLSEGSRLLRRPDHKASLRLDWRPVRPAVGLGLDAQWVGERSDLDPATFETVDAPSYLVIGVGASWDLGAHVRLHARVDNVFDERYQEVLGFATPGRSGYVGARFEL